MAIDNNVHAPALTLLFLAAIRPITVGDVVTYHGSIRSERGGEFVVVKIAEDGRLKIRYRDYQEHSLSNVRRSSITPTGEHLEVCDCGHTIDNNVHGRACGTYGCKCVKHVPEAEDPADLFAQLATGNEQVIEHDGKPVAVVLPVAEYVQLREQLKWGKH